MNCAGCGVLIEDNLTACSNCVKKINIIVAEEKSRIAIAWKPWLFILFIIFTLFIPFVGLIVGIYGVLKEAKQTQGFILLVLSVVCWSLYIKLTPLIR